MSSRVTVNVTARDLTGNDLRRIRANFHRLGQDMDRAVTQRTRGNFDRLRSSINATSRDLQSMRGSIPDDEFFRLDTAMRRAQRTAQRGFGRVGNRAFQRMIGDLQTVRDGFDDLNRNAQIRVRVDDSALRRADARLAAWRRTQAARGVRVRVDPDVDRHRVRTFLLRSLTSPLRSVGGLISGTLSDGIGQGILGAVQAAGPVMATIVVGAIMAALSIVGAALSGLLITTLGAAFVGVGVVAAATSDQIKAKWSSVLKDLKSDFRGLAEPMIPVLDRGLDRLREMSSVAAPVLKKAISDTSSATEEFMNRIVDGFENFGRIAFKPIMDAWNVFAPVFGDEWDEFMQELGHSFEDMANLVKEHPTEIAAALDIVFETIDLLIDTITFFGKVWVQTLQHGGDVLAGFIDVLKVFAIATLDTFDVAVEGVTRFLEIIPGMGGGMREARESFKNFRDGVIEDLGMAAESARNFGADLDKANRKRKLEADINTWQSRLAQARRDLKKTTDQKAKTNLKADISDFQAKINKAWQELAKIDGANAVAYITTYSTTYRSVHDIVGKATGGVRGLSAAATGGVRRNATMVGEHGPEIVDLPAGSRVRSNSDTRRILGQGGGQSVPIQVNLVVDGKTLATAMFDPTREIVRNKGGLTRAYGS